MKLKRKGLFWTIISLFIVLLLLIVTFFLCPKIIFLESSAEYSLVCYKYKQFVNGLVIKSCDKEKALKLFTLPNTHLVITPTSDHLYDIEVPYHTFSSFEKGRENCFYLDFSSFITSLENVAVLDDTSDDLDLSTLPKTVKVVTYDGKISKYEVDKIKDKLKSTGARGVVITNLSDTKDLLTLENLTFYIPKGGEKIYKGSNIYTYSPDLDSLFCAVKKGLSVEIGYKILPSSK